MKKIVKRGQSPLFQIDVPETLKQRFMEMPIGETTITHDECPGEVWEVIRLIKTVINDTGDDHFRGVLGIHGKNSDSIYHPPMPDVFSRFVVHLGHITTYRLTADSELKLNNGTYFILGPARIMPCTVSTVRPRFQPRNYKRVTILLDFVHGVDQVEELVDNIKEGKYTVDENVIGTLNAFTRARKK